MIFIIIIAIIIVLYIVYMKREQKESNKNTPSPRAMALAEEFVDTFKNAHNPQRMNELSEEMIQMAATLWENGDYEGYNALRNAAKETSYAYSGNKYRHYLVEDLISETHS